MPGLIDTIYDWFMKAKPEPTTKDFSVQLGVHFEEVAEMIDALNALNPQTAVLLDLAKSSIENLSNHLKTNDMVVEVRNRIDFVDALADQIVTAIGTGYTIKIDVPGALDEVNESNWSKFDKDGNPIFDDNRKIMKGEGYFKADLANFV